MSSCRRYPGHSNEAGVNAKLWIIGRAYATGIERMIPTDGRPGGSMSRISAHLVKHAGQLDDLFGHLRQLNNPLDADKLRTILDVHGQFIAFIQPVVRRDRSARSFASKYMHFHFPTVPIIDSYTKATCRKMIRWQRAYRLFDLPASVDKNYAEYVFRFWQLYQQAVRVGLEPTVKQIDYFLLSAWEDIK